MQMMNCFCGADVPLKHDKRGKPYLSCSYCGLRMFINSSEALGGLMAFSELVKAAGGSSAWRRAAVEAALKTEDPFIEKTTPAASVSEMAKEIFEGSAQ